MKKFKKFNWWYIYIVIILVVNIYLYFTRDMSDFSTLVISKTPVDIDYFVELSDELKNEQQSIIKVNKTLNPVKTTELVGEDVDKYASYADYNMQIDFDDNVYKILNKYITKYKIEEEQENYAVLRRVFVIDGDSYNEKYGDIWLDWNFNYPRITGYKNTKFQEEINAKMFSKTFLFFCVQNEEETLQMEERIPYDPFAVYSSMQSSDFAVTYANSKLLSMSYNTYWTEGASGLWENSGITLDMENGKVLKVSDFITTEEILKAINSDNYDIIGRITGTYGNKAHDKIVKEELISHINEYSANETMFFTSGFYVDGDYIYIAIYYLENYGDQLLLKIPYTIE